MAERDRDRRALDGAAADLPDVLPHELRHQLHPVLRLGAELQACADGGPPMLLQT